jgi:hypothetical protein
MCMNVTTRILIIAAGLQDSKDDARGGCCWLRAGLGHERPKVV